MNANSDPEFIRYAETDFNAAKRVAEVPALARLQAAHTAKTTAKSRITMRVDNATLAIFKARADRIGGSYQTLMNEALRQFAEGTTLADIVRETIRQELHCA